MKEMQLKVSTLTVGVRDGMLVYIGGRWKDMTSNNNHWSSWKEGGHFIEQVGCTLPAACLSINWSSFLQSRRHSANTTAEYMNRLANCSNLLEIKQTMRCEVLDCVVLKRREYGMKLER